MHINDIYKLIIIQNKTIVWVQIIYFVVSSFVGLEALTLAFLALLQSINQSINKLKQYAIRLFQNKTTML